jgi:hypothetical protein
MCFSVVVIIGYWQLFLINNCSYSYENRSTEIIINMRYLKNTFILLLSCFFSLSVKSQVTLENSMIRLVTDGKHITSLYDKVRGFEHISSDYESANGIFGIAYVNKTSLQTVGTVNAGSITNVTLQSSSASHATYIFENNVLKATVTVNLIANKAETFWNIGVELKNENYAVSQVDFVRFRTPQKHNGITKQFIEPSGEGMRRFLTQAIQYWRAYPGSQTMQLGIVNSTENGFTIWTDDTKGNVKSFGYLNSGVSSNFAVRHYMPFESHIWQATYNTRVSLHGKEWQDGADIYKEWVKDQFWCATPLRKRTDVSDLLHQSPLVISTQLDREAFSTLPARLKAWSDKFGTPVIYRPLGWEKYGNWVGIDYFPVSIGEANFVNLVADLRAIDITVAGFPQGYNWVTGINDASVEVNNALLNYYNDNNGPSVSRTDVNGTPYSSVNEKRITSYICRGSEYGQTHFQWIARELFNRGVMHVHDDGDHLTGLGGPCHNPAHGHPVPYGTWETDVMNQVFSEVIGEAKSRNLNDFILSRENGYELQNMLLHGYQVRNFHVVSSRKNLTPLFLYLYHEYIPAIFGLVTANAKRNVQMCAMLVYGQVPSIAFWNAAAREPTTNVIEQNSADVLKDYYDIMKTHGKDFLLYGKMLRPLINSSNGTIHTSWEDDKGRIGVFAVDTLDIATSVELTIPGSGQKYMTVFSGSTEVFQSVVTGGQIYIWQIPKWRLCSVVFSDYPTDFPYANAGTDKSFNFIPDSVIFEVVALDDSLIVSQQWEKLSGPSCSLVTVDSLQLVVKELEEGEYTFRLTVTDNEGNTASDEVKLTIFCEFCHTPEVSVSSDRIIQLPQDTVLLQGSATVEYGSVASYLWEKVSGPGVAISGAETAEAVLENLGEGIYVFRLTATSDAGFSASDEVTVTVLGAPEYILKSSTELEIDGALDSSWCSPLFTLDNLVKGFANIASKGGFLYDEDHLYVYVEVEDGYLMHDSGDEWWHDDAVEVYIDADNSKGTTYDSNDFRYGFRWHWTVAGMDMFEAVHGATEGVEWKMIEVSGGYRLEAAFPWTTLNHAPGDGDEIGLEIRVLNDDDGSVNDAIKAKFGFSGEQVPVPSQFGTMVLEGACPAVTRVNEAEGNRIRVYPTLTDGVVYIESVNLEEFTCKVFCITGAAVRVKQFIGSSSMSLFELPAGIYFLRLEGIETITTIRITKST